MNFEKQELVNFKITGLNDELNNIISVLGGIGWAIEETPYVLDPDADLKVYCLETYTSKEDEFEFSNILKSFL